MSMVPISMQFCDEQYCEEPMIYSDVRLKGIWKRKHWLWVVFMLDAAIRQIPTTHKKQPTKSGFQRIDLSRKFTSFVDSW
jgi:hypothetical protein